MGRDDCMLIHQTICVYRKNWMHDSFETDLSPTEAEYPESD